MIPRIQVIGITGLPEVRPGDPLGKSIVDAASSQGTSIEANDILIVSQKVVSKTEGRLVDLRTVRPSPFARQLAASSGRDPRVVELVLQESRAIVRMDLSRGILITETQHGFVCANAGIDASNVPGDDIVALLPIDPDRSATQIQQQVGQALDGGDVAVLITDTFGRAWREGHTDFAIGAAGIESIKDYRGTRDTAGKVLKVTRMAVADELASAAELVMGKAVAVPAAIIRGYPFRRSSAGAKSLVREAATDLFR